MADKIKVYKEFNLEGQICLFHGEAISLLKKIPDSSVSLIVSSPPYNLGKEYETRVEFESYIAEQKEIFSELVRVLKGDGSVCWQVGNYVEDGELFPLDIFFYSIFNEFGFKLRNRIIWHFGHGLHAQTRFSGRYETILWFTKTDDYVFNLDSVRVPAKYPGKRHSKGPRKGKPSGNPKGKNPSDYWELICREWEEGIVEIPNVKANHVEKTSHPCQFPVELIERCVLALTNEDDWVLDPYAGVGSSLIAGIKHGRRVVGAEKEKDYINIARQRIRQFLAGDLPLRKLGKTVYTPKANEKVAQIPKQWKKKKKSIYNGNE